MKCASASLAAVSLGVCLSACGAMADDLETGFVHPPDSARPHTWWHWMNGNVTREGITADLEAMARVGVGGAQIFNASEEIPHGPIGFNGPEWVELVKHAAREAHHWTRDDAPLPSGLFGPVLLRTVKVVPLR
jgi:hypothetical protein